MEKESSFLDAAEHYERSWRGLADTAFHVIILVPDSRFLT
jgi:hypothetical protein